MVKILFCRWNSICEKGITRAMVSLNYDVVYLDRKFSSVDYDKDYLLHLSTILIENPDIEYVFSVNFMPIISRVCHTMGKKYVSWIVDSPCFQLYSETLSYETNRVFLFDKSQYDKFYQQNENGIFYFPLGCDYEFLDEIKISDDEHKNYDCDVSFVGSLYSEKCVFNQIYEDLTLYMKGYADGLINAQMQVYGYNFLEDVITSEWADRFKKEAPWNALASDYSEDMIGIVADTYLGQKCTEQERIQIFQMISEKHDMHLWTLSDTSMFDKVKVRGGADSDTMMPQIIKCSKINLNLTNRPIKTGLPLRIFDILGCGGFLISNYQAEIPLYFEPDRDLVLFQTREELMDKIAYYLNHDEERKEIARNGHQKVKESFSYSIRLKEMFEKIAK